MNSQTRIFFSLLLAGVAAYSSAQESTASREPEAKKESAPAPRESSAWRLDFPLGEHIKADIDTLPYNYQMQAIPSLATDAFLTTGNLGGEGETLILLDRKPGGPFFFESTLSPWMITKHNLKFYNVYTPMTLASYNFAGGRDNAQNRLKGIFAGNVNRRIGIGAHFDYLYSKGMYNYQAVKDYVYGLNGYYLGDRYELQAFINQNSMLNKENGGITDELYITDPAQLQGGVSKIEPKSIPTNLTAAHTRLHTTEFYMNHAYKIGYWREEQVNDTLRRNVYVPVVRFLYVMDYKKGRHTFINTSASENEKFWKATYLDPDRTYDRTSYWSLANTVGVQMVEGFRKWVRFGLSAYATYELRNYRQTAADRAESVPTPWPDGVTIPEKQCQNLLWIGGRLDKSSGKVLTYAADAKFGMIGDVAGDLDISGRLATRFKLFGDTVRIAANGFFKNEEPSYLLKKYVSNHFIWDNDFGKTRTIRAEGELEIPWTKTLLRIGVQNTQNLIYFDTDAIPRQEGGNVQVFTARLQQKLRFGIWNWNNNVTYQATSNSNVLPLPALAIYSNMYLNFTAFKVLNMQIGVDCDYYTRYNAYLYQPATMSFHIAGGDAKAGNYAFCNAYITCKLYRARFFVLFSHFNQGWFGYDYFSMPGYPLNPRRLQFGLSVDFAN